MLIYPIGIGGEILKMYMKSINSEKAFLVLRFGKLNLRDDKRN